jgi:hypothetical protein
LRAEQLVPGDPMRRSQTIVQFANVSMGGQ